MWIHFEILRNIIQCCLHQTARNVTFQNQTRHIDTFSIVLRKRHIQEVKITVWNAHKFYMWIYFEILRNIVQCCLHQTCQNTETEFLYIIYEHNAVPSVSRDLTTIYWIQHHNQHLEKLFSIYYGGKWVSEGTGYYTESGIS